MKKKIAITALAACAVLVAAGPAQAAPGETTVTIRNNASEGTVKSNKENKCANGRLVKLYKQKGDKGGGNDRYTGLKDSATANGDRFTWNLGNPGLNPGKYYARAKRIDGCEADNSRTVTID